MSYDYREPQYEVHGSGAAAEAGATSGPREPGPIETFLDSHIRPGTRDWAVACHAAPMLAYAVPIPFLGILMAWGVWRLKRDREPGVATHGREALNFQLNVTFWSFVGMVLFVLPYFVVSAVAVVLAIKASIRAAQGEAWRYPFILRLID